MNRNNDVKWFEHLRCYLPNRIVVNYNVVIDEKNFYHEAIDSVIKLYEDIRKSRTGESKDYTTGCLLDYDYIKNHYRLLALDLSG